MTSHKPKAWKAEIVEKVARAFYTEARRLDLRCSVIKPWSKQKDETIRNRWRGYARAALAVVPITLSKPKGRAKK